MIDPALAGELQVERLAELVRLEAPWRKLSAVCGNPFLTWEWASAWWRHFGRDREQMILGFSDASGNLLGIAPLYFKSRRPLRALRTIGHFPADQLGLLCAPEHEPDVRRSLHAYLAASRDWDLLLDERVPVAEGSAPAQPGRLLNYEEMPQLRIASGDWDEFLGTKSSNFRGQARNYERRLLRDSSLEYRLCADPDRLEADMRTLFDLHQRAWAAKSEPGAFPEALSAFHLDFAREALASGWLRLWIAELEGAPAAAWYGFRLRDTDWYYQGGRDPKWERSSVGFVLMTQTVRDAVESGVGLYKLLLGTEEYKKRFSNELQRAETRATTRTLRGRLGVAAVLAKNTLRR